MAAYRATARRFQTEEQHQLSLRHQRAWKLAREGAALLKKRFGAKRVALFGSLLCKDLFHARVVLKNG